MPNKKISELSAAGALTGAELVEAVQSGQNVKTTTQDIANLGVAGGGGTWGTIIGTLSNQTDLQTALDQKTTDLNAHINDTTDAHDASAISFTPTGKIGSANVQAAIAELDTEVDERILDALAGLKWKDSVRVATTGPGTLATSFENGDTLDGVVLATGDRILLKDQADQTENGIRIVAASGAPARSTDADTATELEGAAVSVLEGSTNANTTWLQITDSITLGSSNIVFTQYGSSVPDADASTKGIMKKYTTTGSNTDGTMTQLAITNAVATPNIGNLLYLYENFR